MSEFESHEGLPREAEVLRARRESLERLREAGIEPFALRYDVDTLASDLIAEFDGKLANEEESDRRASVAGRVVLARRHGKLTFLVIRDRERRPAALLRGGDARRRIRAARRDRPGRHRRRHGPRRAHASRGTLAQGRHAHLADEGAASAAREVARVAGPRSPATTALPAPDHRPGAAAVRRRARHRVAHDPSRAGRSRIHRGRDAHPATGRRRRAGQAVHDPPQRVGHRPQAPHLARALPEAIAGRRPRADLRDGPQLPQRGHRPGTQPGVHDAGAVRGVRRLRDDDADRRGPDPRVRAGVARVPRAHVPGRCARPGAAVPPGDGARCRCPRRRGHRSSSSAIS